MATRGIADEVSDIEMLCVTERRLALDEAFELARRALGCLGIELLR